jgi:hypothetical protein
MVVFVDNLINKIEEFAVADMSHFESEKVILPVLKELIISHLDANVEIAKEFNPWITHVSY